MKLKFLDAAKPKPPFQAQRVLGYGAWGILPQTITIVPDIEKKPYVLLDIYSGPFQKAQKAQSTVNPATPGV